MAGTAVLIELQLPGPERQQDMDTFCLGLLLVFLGCREALHGNRAHYVLFGSCLTRCSAKGSPLLWN